LRRFWLTCDWHEQKINFKIWLLNVTLTIKSDLHRNFLKWQKNDVRSQISCLNLRFYTSGVFSMDSPTPTLRINLNERRIVLGDSKWSWISMRTMYENLCGNCVGRIELTFFWQFIVAQFWKLSIQCTMVKKNMKCHTVVNPTPPTRLPHKFSSIVAILIHNHFESPTM
jgi:hypothetical protein